MIRAETIIKYLCPVYKQTIQHVCVEYGFRSEEIPSPIPNYKWHISDKKFQKRKYIHYTSVTTCL